MNRMSRLLATAVLLSCGLGLGGLGLAGSAQADCNMLGVCSKQWCPGQTLPLNFVTNAGGTEVPGPPVAWDMKVCHTWYYGSLPGDPRGNHDVIEGQPPAVNPCAGAPICLPGL